MKNEESEQHGIQMGPRTNAFWASMLGNKKASLIEVVKPAFRNLSFLFFPFFLLNSNDHLKQKSKKPQIPTEADF